MLWLWLVLASAAWALAIALIWRFFDRASSDSAIAERDAKDYLERLSQHAESREPDAALVDNKPHWLVSQEKIAKSIWAKDCGAVEGGQPRRDSND